MTAAPTLPPRVRCRVPKSVTAGHLYVAMWPSLLHFKSLLHIYPPPDPKVEEGKVGSPVTPGGAPPPPTLLG